jgi:DNA/RNA endonuclease YhcR with UshA esterase domain
MKQSLTAIGIVVVGIASVCGQTGAVYKATEAAKHIGETATVTDKVDSVHQSGKGNIFLNMGGKYPNQVFTAFIPAANAAQFSDVQQYQGQMVAVTGKITLYHGKPEIAVSSPTQLRLQ